MATATHVQLSPSDGGIYHVPELKQAAAERCSQLLQLNHDKFHIYFDLKDSLHNHLAHHLFSAFALGSSPEILQRAYNLEADYQLPRRPPKDDVLADLRAGGNLFMQHFSGFDNYPEFLVYFTEEVEKNGVIPTLQRFYFADDAVAEGMLKRLLAGYLHPVIHLGFGIDHNQPSIICEGLAETACSSAWTKDYLDAIDKHLASSSDVSSSNKTLFDLQAEILDNTKLVNSVQWNEGNHVRDGILKKAPDEMVAIASQWRVKPDDLERKTAEMIDFCAYITGAALNPNKIIKFDFFYMHAMNASLFFSVFLKLDWMTMEQKCRLLEMKGWLDLALYVAQGSPKLLLDEISKYQPKSTGGWETLTKRIVDHDTDDTHTIKLMRALMNAEGACKPFEEKKDWPIQGPMWLLLGHMVMDMAEAMPSTGLHNIQTSWTRGSGFPEAWEDYPDRKAM